MIVRLRGRDEGPWYVDPSLRDRLRADAIEKGTSITDVVLSIVASHLGVPYVTTGRTSEPQPAADNLRLRVPAPVFQALRLASPRARGMQDLIRETLSRHYGLRVPEKQQRRQPAAA